VTPRRLPFAAACLAVAAASACASAGGAEPESAPPAWFAARDAELEAEGFPDLARAPLAPSGTVDPAHWNAVAAEIVAAEQAMRAHPRSSQTSDAPAPQRFEAEARAALETAATPR
jgi:hypothetical protein